MRARRPNIAIQHNPRVADGLSGLGAALKAEAHLVRDARDGRIRREQARGVAKPRAYEILMGRDAEGSAEDAKETKRAQVDLRGDASDTPQTPEEAEDDLRTLRDARGRG